MGTGSENSNGGRSTGGSRRQFLKAVAATGTLAGANGIVYAQNQEVVEIVLGGVTSGWQGRSPAAIEGVTNPTLELVPETDYRITWENVDGQRHNIVIVNDTGEQLESTEVMSNQGETQTLEFTATATMAEYYCVVHPSSMRGDVATTQGDSNLTGPEEQVPTNATNETAANETISPSAGGHVVSRTENGSRAFYQWWPEDDYDDLPGVVPNATDAQSASQARSADGNGNVWRALLRIWRLLNGT